MSRRTAVAVLALVQTATLVAGATAALAHPSERSVAPVVQPDPEPRMRPTGPLVHVVPAKAVAKPAKPAAKPKPRVRKRVVHHAPPRPRTVRHHRPTTSLTPTERLMRAVDRIPGYHTGDAVWAISSDWGHWGVADLYGGVAYISPTVPADRMYDVVAHEWSHLLMVKAYGGDVMSALSAANSYFGGSDLMGAERAADCMARLLGATWTHYTSCSDSHWRAGARRLLDRQRL
jgi:hypothetical protein